MADAEEGNENLNDAGHLAYLLNRQQAYTIERLSEKRPAELRTSSVFRWIIRFAAQGVQFFCGQSTIVHWR